MPVRPTTLRCLYLLYPANSTKSPQPLRPLLHPIVENEVQCTCKGTDFRFDWSVSCKYNVSWPAPRRLPAAGRSCCHACAAASRPKRCASSADRCQGQPAAPATQAPVAAATRGSAAATAAAVAARARARSTGWLARASGPVDAEQRVAGAVAQARGGSSRGRRTRCAPSGWRRGPWRGPCWRARWGGREGRVLAGEALQRSRAVHGLTAAQTLVSPTAAVAAPAPALTEAMAGRAVSRHDRRSVGSCQLPVSGHRAALGWMRLPPPAARGRWRTGRQKKRPLTVSACRCCPPRTCALFATATESRCWWAWSRARREQQQLQRHQECQQHPQESTHGPAANGGRELPCRTLNAALHWAALALAPCPCCCTTTSPTHTTSPVSGWTGLRCERQYGAKDKPHTLLRLGPRRCGCCPARSRPPATCQNRWSRGRMHGRLGRLAACRRCLCASGWRAVHPGRGPGRGAGRPRAQEPAGAGAAAAGGQGGGHGGRWEPGTAAGGKQRVRG